MQQISTQRGMSCSGGRADTCREMRWLPFPAVLVALAATALLAAAHVRIASAAVIDMRNLVAARPSLMHHYTFEGLTTLERNEDKKASLDLFPATYGNATAANITYSTGFDATTTNVVTYRNGGDAPNDGGVNASGGAGLTSYPRAFTPGPNPPTPATSQLMDFGSGHPDITVEMLVRPDVSSVTGGTGGIAYVAMIRENGPVRGSFLFQGSAAGPGIDNLSTLAGAPFSTTNEKTIVDGLIPGHWYYYASNYVVQPGFADTTVTSYVADLTAGETILTNLGTTVLPNGPYTNAATPQAPLGVGIADNYNQNAGDPFRSAFPGAIDELAFYLEVLDQATLQSHLDAIWLNAGPAMPVVPEPGSLALLSTALFSLLLRRRKRRA